MQLTVPNTSGVSHYKMSDLSVSGGSDRFEVNATAQSHFAWLRTRLAVERTLMAWVRTAVSLIGFGFAIVQFFDRMDQMPGVSPARYPGVAHYLGLSLIFCGVMALVISLWEYRWINRYLAEGSFAAIAGVIGGRETYANHRSFRPPCRYWHFRLFCRVAAFRVAALRREGPTSRNAGLST